MWIARKEDDARLLHQVGLDALARGELDAARAHGETLVQIGWVPGYELLALAHRAAGDRARACALLEEGSALAPTAWSLRELLGTIRSEDGALDAALEAYDAALATPGAWRGSIAFNRATTLAAHARWGEALAGAEQALEDSRGAPFTLEALRLAVRALGHLGRTDDAVALAEGVVAQAGHDSPALDVLVGALAAAQADDARLAATCARAVEAGVAGLEVARVQARKTGTPSLRPIWDVVIEGPRPADAPPEVAGILRVAEVAADSPEHALSLVAALEPEATRPALAILRATPRDPDVRRAEVLRLGGPVRFTHGD